MWSIIELNLGIICGCAMRLKPLITRYLPQLGLFSTGSRGTEKLGSRGKGLRTDDSEALHRYQLHSIQKGSTEPVYDSGDSRGYRLHRLGVGGKGVDGGSSEENLA